MPLSNLGNSSKYIQGVILIKTVKKHQYVQCIGVYY